VLQLCPRQPTALLQIPPVVTYHRDDARHDRAHVVPKARGLAGGEAAIGTSSEEFEVRIAVGAEDDRRRFVADLEPGLETSLAQNVSSP
jgi:hypothetical protein